ncbi:MAG: LysR family transcriptional regulator [Pseudomonadota bacterium]|nr:LysR family transcriptional regulator [Pseudomonadota bacterium]
MSPPLRSIGVFHAAARLASVAKAAEELGVTPSAVSQQIHALEIQLGASLVTKAGRGIKLTEAGERYFNSIAESLERIAEATDRIRGYHAVTTLTIRASPTLSTKWLLPRLSSFLEAHPQFDVRVDGTSEPTDFAREDVDIDIRHGTGVWPGLFVEGLAQETFFPVCAPGYAAPGALAAAALVNHRLIHSVKSQAQWSAWFKTMGVEVDRRWRRVLFDRSHMAIDAAASGMGIALESDLMMWRELRDGALIRPVAAPSKITLTTQWLACPHDHLRHFKVRAFLDWIRVQRDAWAAASGV